MEKDKLRILLQVLEDQSFSATAQKLGYTPSGISRAITALEDTFGFPLLIRKANGVKPTEACLALLPEIHEILHHEDLLFQKAQEINGVAYKEGDTIDWFEDCELYKVTFTAPVGGNDSTSVGDSTAVGDSTIAIHRTIMRDAQYRMQRDYNLKGCKISNTRNRAQGAYYGRKVRVKE